VSTLPAESFLSGSSTPAKMSEDFFFTSVTHNGKQFRWCQQGHKQGQECEPHRQSFFEEFNIFAGVFYINQDVCSRHGWHMPKYGGK